MFWSLLRVFLIVISSRPTLDCDGFLLQVTYKFIRDYTSAQLRAFLYCKSSIFTNGMYIVSKINVFSWRIIPWCSSIRFLFVLLRVLVASRQTRAVLETRYENTLNFNGKLKNLSWKFPFLKNYIKEKIIELWSKTMSNVNEWI